MTYDFKIVFDHLNSQDVEIISLREETTEIRSEMESIQDSVKLLEEIVFNTDEDEFFFNFSQTTFF